MMTLLFAAWRRYWLAVREPVEDTADEQYRWSL